MKQVLFVLSTQMCPENQDSRVPGRITAPFIVFTKPVLISMFQSCYQLVFEILLIQQILLSSLLGCGLRSWCPESWENFTLKSFIFGIIQCRFGFYSIFNLHAACKVSTVFIVVEYTWKWPENKYPES